MPVELERTRPLIKGRWALPNSQIYLLNHWEECPHISVGLFPPAKMLTIPSQVSYATLSGKQSFYLARRL
jgi:hypothetical protein